MKTCDGCMFVKCCIFNELDKGCQNYCTEDMFNNR